MNTKPSKPEKKRNPGRPYVPRPCIICANEATLTVQLRTRPLGPGTGVDRDIAYSGPLLLCDRCSRSRDYAAELIDAAQELARKRPRQSIPRGPGLFAVAESAIQ